jgi:hypothetical protein
MAQTNPVTDFDHPLLGAPDYLKRWPSWAAWAAPTKRPLDLRRALAGASVTIPDTWASYDHAMRHLRRVAPPVPYRLPVPLGVGVLIAPPLVFLDFDDLLDDKGRAPIWADTLLDQAVKIGAYVELSASGQGAHIFMLVSANTHLKRNRYTRAHPTSTPVGIEIYAKERFAALTGIPRRPDQPAPHANLNDPKEGDKLLQAFVAELESYAAPILTPDLPPAPLTVPMPTQPVLDTMPALMTPNIREAFSDPHGTFERWQTKRHLQGSDSSLSAWRFSLFLEASRQSSVSPLPVYELFNPQTDPQHPGVLTWQEFSGHNKKPHRKYADIQRAHAMVQEEIRFLAQDLGVMPETPQGAPVPIDPSEADSPPAPADPTWAQLGLVMRTNKGATKPLATSVNYIRVLSRHPAFARVRIERNKLDGSTLCDRLPLSDTQITRWREPLRAVLDMPHDPPVQDVRDAVEVIADDNPYDPLVEYLHSLPQWVPPPEYDPDKSLLSTWLEAIGATPGPDTKKFARRILMGLVARALKPGVKFDYVPVFEGPQGVGKSSLVKALVSPPYYATLFGGLASKDAPMTLRGRWAVELAELVAFKKTDNETMKSFFSTDTDVFRPPYARNLVTIQRRTVLFGTTNDSQYLTDHTGSRRYWSIYFGVQINITWLIEHRDLLFAEAKHFFEKGERFHDTLEEANSPHRLKQMQARLVTPAWQIKLLQHLQNLPKPYPPASDTGMGSSGVLTHHTVAALQEVLSLPPSLAHMNAAQLVTFLQRAGYLPLRLSYRPPEGQPTKLNAWCHPALHRLTPEQQTGVPEPLPNPLQGECRPGRVASLASRAPGERCHRAQFGT